MLDIMEIKKIITPLAKKYEVNHIEIFGSYANETATEDSDIDFLVKFSTPVPSIFKVMGFQEELKKALGLDVDVITLPLSNPEAINIEKRERII